MASSADKNLYNVSVRYINYIELMRTISIFLLAFILALTCLNAQELKNVDGSLAYDSAEGAMLKHLYTGLISLTNTNAR